MLTEGSCRWECQEVYSKAAGGQHMRDNVRGSVGSHVTGRVALVAQRLQGLCNHLVNTTALELQHVETVQCQQTPAAMSEVQVLAQCTKHHAAKCCRLAACSGFELYPA